MEETRQSLINVVEYHGDEFMEEITVDGEDYTCKLSIRRNDLPIFVYRITENSELKAKKSAFYGLYEMMYRYAAGHATESLLKALDSIEKNKTN